MDNGEQSDLPAQIGFRDFPIERPEDDKLGIGPYAFALANYVVKCQTPMTIALQGDWGSGKTSLMYYVEDLIQRSIQTKYPSIKIDTIRFNTWQFSQFTMAEMLPVFMMRHFIEQLDPEQLSDAASIVKSLFNLKKLGNLAAIGISGLFGQGLTAAAALREIERQDHAKDFDPGRQLAELKEKLAALVRERLGDQPQNRIVVFIDDLDRLMPERAVELLECLKLFMDVDGCVYVLACDYDVVVRGLRRRFDVDDDSLSRRFFDKLIQLPFRMPTPHYKVKTYFKESLKRMRLSVSDENAEQCVELMQHSTGFNPRYLKRLLNQLWLLWDVGRRQLDIASDDHVATSQDRMRVLFAVLCMQMRYPSLYEFLLRTSRREISDQLFNELIEPENIKHNKAFAQLYRDLDRRGRATDASVEQMCGFVDKLFTCMQLHSDWGPSAKESLSEGEIETFHEILHMSSVIATSKSKPRISTNERLENRRFGRRLATDLNRRCERYFADFEFSDTTGFQVYQYKAAANPSVCFQLKLAGNWGLRFEFSSARAEMYLFANQNNQDELIQWVMNEVGPRFSPNQVTINQGAENEFVQIPLNVADHADELTHEERMEIFANEVNSRLGMLLPLIGEFIAQRKSANHSFAQRRRTPK